ncbi:MAG: hypothetical protein PHI66_02025 [Candidatus Pacebacteria bacterium]|nr:hypothetical protein [Candidatus Paceibacterota bacterium]
MEEETTQIDTTTVEAPIETDTAIKEEKKSKPLNKKFIGALIAIVALTVSYSAYTNGKLDAMLGKEDTGAVLGASIDKAEMEKFINENLVSNGYTATVTNITEESGLYKVELDVNGQAYTSYMTKDETKFFTSAIDMEEIKKAKEDAANETAATSEVTKSEKPVVELFVMSHCPYGTQIEKGMLPVVKALGDKIDFELKFCDYAMHGEKELNEQINQYCIAQNEPDKLVSYLECFLGAGDGTTCLAQVGIDKNKLGSCVKTTDNQYQITAGFNDKSTWKSGTYPVFSIFQEDVDAYGITGSPSLVVNGTKVSAGRDSQSLLNSVCSAFENAPEECNQALSSTSPSAGFGYGEGSDSGASCE